MTKSKIQSEARRIAFDTIINPAAIDQLEVVGSNTYAVEVEVIDSETNQPVWVEVRFQAKDFTGSPTTGRAPYCGVTAAAEYAEEVAAKADAAAKKAAEKAKKSEKKEGKADA